jgi:hypothetical protein
MARRGDMYLCAVLSPHSIGAAGPQLLIDELTHRDASNRCGEHAIGHVVRARRASLQVLHNIVETPRSRVSNWVCHGYR